MCLVRTAVSDRDWQQGLSILYDVYVGEGHSPAERAAEVYRREVLEREGNFLVAVRGDTVLGATILLHPGSALHQMARPGEREFRLLAVSATERGQGAGEALVRACMERSRAEGASALVLWTRPSMNAAQRLYTRLGFLHEQERDEEDPRGFMRLVYRLALAAV